MALEHARDVYTRRQEGVSIWVVRVPEILASDPADADALFEPARDKMYRHPTFYAIPDEVKNAVSATRCSTVRAAAESATAALRAATRDASLVLGQRLGEWIGHAPALEEDLGLANLSLDLIGQARLLLTYAGEVEGRGPRRGRARLFPQRGRVPQPDAGRAAERRFRADDRAAVPARCLAARALHGARASSDARLAAIAAKSLKETKYHLRYSAGWLVRLGDGTEESQRRAQRALEELWRFTTEMFVPDAVDAEMAAAGIAPPIETLAAALGGAGRCACSREAKLARPADVPYSWHGKRGQHSEHLGYLLAEMQSLQRAHPGAQW